MPPTRNAMTTRTRTGTVQRQQYWQPGRARPAPPVRNRARTRTQPALPAQDPPPQPPVLFPPVQPYPAASQLAQAIPPAFQPATNNPQLAPQQVAHVVLPPDIQGSANGDNTLNINVIAAVLNMANDMGAFMTKILDQGRRNRDGCPGGSNENIYPQPSSTHS